MSTANQLDHSSFSGVPIEPATEEDGMLLGVPRQQLQYVASVAADGSDTSVAEEQATSSDTVLCVQEIEQWQSLGAPIQRADDSVPVATAASILLTPSVLVETEDDELETTNWLPRRPSWRGVWYIGLIVLSLMALIALSQVISLLSQVASLPLISRYAVYSALGVIAAIGGYAALGLIRAYFRFRRTPAISVKVWEQLSERATLRREANDAANEARRHLQVFLEEYALDDGRACRQELRRLRFEKPEIKLLLANRADLLSGQSANASSEGWIKDFDTRFAGVLDTVAHRRVEHYARIVGAATAVAPNNVVDTAIVVTNAMLMIRDLCCIYNLRTTRLGAALIGVRVFINAFVAAELDDWSEETVTGLSRLLHDTMGVSLPSGVPVLGQVMKGLTKRAAVCATNYLLCKRLGKATMRHLRPLQMK